MTEYLNTWEIVDKHNLPFNFFIAGRGCGKTYSTLRGILDRCVSGRKFVYLRRTDTELDSCMLPATQPFKVINSDLNCNITLMRQKKMICFVDESKNEMIGYGMALSTIKSFRGMDFSDVDYLIFDEFIPELHSVPIRREGEAFDNAYETINRNRELMGKEPVVCIFLGNSNTLRSPLLTHLKLTDTIRQMKINAMKFWSDSLRGVTITLGSPDGFVDQKRNTALYRLTENTNFSSMALDNDFVDDFFGDVRKMNLREFRALCRFDKITFFEHKNNNSIYVTSTKATCPTFERNEFNVFKNEFGFYLRDKLNRRAMFFINYDIKVEACDLLKF